MENRKYMIFSNRGPKNDIIDEKIHSEMSSDGWQETADINEAAFVFCLGGDGALLRLMRKYSFPEVPIIGINTGHLGYYQEIDVDELDLFFEKFRAGEYFIQEHIGLGADIYDRAGNKYSHVAINEVVIRGEGERLMHLGIKVKGRDITKFSGDGVLICTPAGSTAYNYSLGGAIVDPSVDMIEITPMAPVNNTLYRSFLSSIVMPTDTEIEIIPDEPTPGAGHKNVVVIGDGGRAFSGDVARVVIKRSEKKARIVNLGNFDFWSKVKEKITG